MPIEQTKQIVRYGRDAFCVILPRAWLRYYDLDDKDSVQLIANGKITIKPIFHSKKKSKSNLKPEKEIEA